MIKRFLLAAGVALALLGAPQAAQAQWSSVALERACKYVEWDSAVLLTMSYGNAPGAWHWYTSPQNGRTPQCFYQRWQWLGTNDAGITFSLYACSHNQRYTGMLRMQWYAHVKGADPTVRYTRYDGSFALGGGC